MKRKQFLIFSLILFGILFINFVSASCVLTSPDQCGNGLFNLCDRAECEDCGYTFIPGPLGDISGTCIYILPNPNCKQLGQSCGYSQTEVCCIGLACANFQCVDPNLFICGDGICQSNEDITSCIQDCSGAISSVRFRTNDASYVTSGAIAYSNTCGSTLTQYGYVSGSGLLTGNCASASKTWCGTTVTLALSNLPGGYKSGGDSPSLWTTNDANVVCLCDEGSDGKYFFKKYSTLDSDKTKVSSDPQATGSLEVAC